MSRVPSTDKLVKKTMLLDACSTRFSRYVNLSSFLTQIGKVTYSSFVLIGHKFSSPSLLRSYIERALLHYSNIHSLCLLIRLYVYSSSDLSVECQSILCYVLYWNPVIGDFISVWSFQPLCV